MIDHPSIIKIGGDIVGGITAYLLLLTLDQWTSIASITASVATTTWFLYRFADDCYQKWKKNKDKMR